MTVVQTYEVDVAFRGRDQGAQAMADKLGVSLTGLQGRLDGAAQAIERVGMAGLSLVGAGALLGVRALTHGVNELNARAESTTLVIAGMLQANSAADSLTSGLTASRDVLTQIRRDAAALPGEAQDFVNVFQLGLPAALQAGMRDARQVAAFTNQFGAIATAFQVDSQQAGRDLRFMLQGHAGAHVAMWNHLSSLIGKSSEEFNKLSAPQRLAALQRATAHYGDMVNAYGGTWEAATSTIRSAGSELLRVGTAPLFERAKARAGELADYLTRNGPAIELQMERWGVTGAHAFDLVTEKGRRALTYLRDHWREVVGEIRDSAHSALMLYAGLRVASGAVGAVGFGMQAAGSLTTALGGAGAATAGSAGLAAAAGATVAVGAMALAVHDGLFDLDAALLELQPTVDLVKEGWRDFATQARPLIAEAGAELAHSVVGIVTAAGKVAYVLLEFGAGVSRALRWVNEMRTNAVGMLIGGQSDRVNYQDSMNAATGAQMAHNDELQRDRDRELRDFVANVHGRVAQRPPERRPDPAAAARKHHTTIHNNFKIEQAENPERVALSVAHVMRVQLRNPTQAARPGLTRLR